MMRPMKLAGSELMFGEGSLAYIKTIKAKKVSIVIGGHRMEKSGMLAKDILKKPVLKQWLSEA